MFFRLRVQPHLRQLLAETPHHLHIHLGAGCQNREMHQTSHLLDVPGEHLEALVVDVRSLYRYQIRKNS